MKSDETPTFRIRGRWLEGVSDVLNRDTATAPLVNEGLVRARWAEIVGADIAAKVTIVSLKGTTLLVTTEDEAWSHELNWLKDPILKRINTEVGEGIVNNISVIKRGKPGRRMIGFRSPENPR